MGEPETLDASVHPPPAYNPAPFSWGKNHPKFPPFHCENCGKFNPWMVPNQMMPWSPFRLCQDCMEHEPPYGECIIESEGEVVKLEKDHGVQEGGSFPRWRVVGKKLTVAPYRISFSWSKGSW